MRTTKLNVITKLAIATIFFGSAINIVHAEDNSKYVKIALLGPLTGSNSFQGSIANLAAKFAVDSVNKKGIRDNKQISVIPFNAKCDINEVKKEIDRIVKEKIDYVVGPICYYPRDTFDIFKEKNILNFHLSIASDYNTYSKDQHRFFVRNSDVVDANGMVKFLKSRQKTPVVAFFADSVAINSTVAEGRIRALKEAGNKIANEKVEIVKDFKNIDEHMKLIKDSNANVVYVSSRESNLAVRFAQEIKKAGLDTIVFGDSTLETSDVYSNLKQYSDIVYFTAPAHYSELAQNDAITNAFKKDKKFNIVPSLAYETYSIITILAEALDKANSLKTKDVADYINNNTFQTAIGPVTFDNYVKNNLDTIILKWTQDGEIVEAK